MDSNKYAMDLEKVEREIQLDNIKEIISKKCEKKYDTHLEFSTRVFEKHAELWIYVVDDHSYFDEIQTICEKLSNDKIWILVNKWSGPWPGASEDLEPKRKEFKERMSKKFKGGGEIEAQPFMELAEFAEFAAK